MPESVRDRCTESHEYIIMMTKSARYYWDMEAVRESAEYGRRDWNGNIHFQCGDITRGPNGKTTGSQPEAGRNLRSVWTFPSQPFPPCLKPSGEHFATFPEKLPETCIKAATPEYGCCAKCGKPYERIVESKPMEMRRTDWGERAGNRTVSSGTMVNPPETKTLGWQPGCKCNAGISQATILDPFAGSGTTLWVARKLGRKAVGYELSSEYCKLIIERNRQMALTPVINSNEVQ